jgi:hypothetical protein
LKALFDRIHAKVVKEIGDDATAKMMEVPDEPVLHCKMLFGKHKGLKMGEVPVDYLQFLTGTHLEEDMRYTGEHYSNYLWSGFAW